MNAPTKFDAVITAAIKLLDLHDSAVFNNCPGYVMRQNCKTDDPQILSTHFSYDMLSKIAAVNGFTLDVDTGRYPQCRLLP